MRIIRRAYHSPNALGCSCILTSNPHAESIKNRAFPIMPPVARKATCGGYKLSMCELTTKIIARTRKKLVLFLSDITDFPSGERCWDEPPRFATAHEGWGSTPLSRTVELRVVPSLAA